MRLPRPKPPPGRVAYYHCTSRIVDRVKRLGDVEKEYFVRQLRRYEAFCGVRICTYTIMSNHFHLLVEVPGRPNPPPSVDALLARLEAFYSRAEMSSIRSQLAAAGTDPEKIARWKEPYLRRMWDISRFMQELKQTFSRWYNQRLDRQGTLWESRFRCSLVQGHSLALAVVAGYIDLNPVRAQLVHDPLEYRWNGYAEAMAGNASQRDALESVLPPEYRCLESYRMLIHQAGREQFGPDGRPTRPGFKPETIARVWTEGGRISAAELIRCRVRYMVEGVVIGSREFVEDVFRGIRSYYNPRRRTGARRVRGLDPPVFSLKRFRLNPVTAPEPAGGSP